MDGKSVDEFLHGASAKPEPDEEWPMMVARKTASRLFKKCANITPADNKADFDGLVNFIYSTIQYYLKTAAHGHKEGGE